MTEFGRPPVRCGPPVVCGVVYGTLLNHRSALEAFGAAVNAPPYKAPPKAPVLYIKPRNTWIGPGEAVVVPDGVEELEMGATLGLVIGRSACRVHEAAALSFVAGYVIVNDVSVPHASYYRPSLRFKARDTFCPIGPFVPRERMGSPDAVTSRSRSMARSCIASAPLTSSGQRRGFSPV